MNGDSPARVRKLTRLSHVPIAILTPSESPAEMQEAYALGAVRYLRMPTMLDEFPEHVAERQRAPSRLIPGVR